MYDKFKRFVENDSFYYGALIVLVAVCSFGLGRLSDTAFISPTMAPAEAITSNQAQVSLSQEKTQIKPMEEEQTTSVSASGSFVASKNGTKYHLTTCPGAKQIKEENKIYFETQEEAQARGYTKAANCKGL
jgi:hypothetical protein